MGDGIFRNCIGVEKLGKNPMVENIAKGAKSIGDEARDAVENMR